MNFFYSAQHNQTTLTLNLLQTGLHLSRFVEINKRAFGFKLVSEQFDGYLKRGLKALKNQFNIMYYRNHALKWFEARRGCLCD